MKRFPTMITLLLISLLAFVFYIHGYATADEIILRIEGMT